MSTNVPILDFLWGHNGLRKAVEHIPHIREYIDSRPETANTFTLKKALGGTDANAKMFTHAPEMMEFVGTWRVPERYNPDSSDRYVVPGSPDAESYRDVVAECACGATFTKMFGRDAISLDDPTDHTDDCTIQNRLRARARLAEKRATVMERCLRLGWSAEQAGVRIGLSGGAISNFCADAGVDIGGLRSEYRRRRGNTYVKLTQEGGFSGREASAILGVSRHTGNRSARRYGDYTWVGGERPSDGRWVLASAGGGGEADA